MVSHSPKKMTDTDGVSSEAIRRRGLRRWLRGDMEVQFSQGVAQKLQAGIRRRYGLIPVYCEGNSTVDRDLEQRRWACKTNSFHESNV
jgi:hypothetical protein